MISAIQPLEEKQTPEYFVMPQSKFLDLLNKNLYCSNEDNFNQKIVYRKNTSHIDCIHIYDKETGNKIRTTHYDYFNDKKIKSIDEYDPQSGQKIRTTNFTLYKSVTEFNSKTGKRLKTINYSLRDEKKIISIHEYHSIYDKIVRISIFRPDGKSISMVKEVNPITERVEQCINYKRNSNVVSSVSKYEFQNNKIIKTTCYYNDYTESIKEFTKENITEEEKSKTAKLIDNLFGKNLSFSTLQL